MLTIPQSKPYYGPDPVTCLTAVREFPAVFRGIFDLDLGFSVSPYPSVLHSSVNYP